MGKKSGGKKPAANKSLIGHEASEVPVNRGGRPSKYKPEYVQELLDYCGVPPYVEVTKEVITQAGPFEMKANEASDFFTKAGFAAKIGVSRDTLHQWSQTYPEFGEVYNRFQDFQEHYLLVNGLKDLIPAAFGIFTLKNVAGYRDKAPGEDDKTVRIEAKVRVERVDIEERIAQVKEVK